MRKTKLDVYVLEFLGKFCLKLFKRDEPMIYWNIYSTCKNCFLSIITSFQFNFIDRMQVVGCSMYRVPDLSLPDLDSFHRPRIGHH